MEMQMNRIPHIYHNTIYARKLFDIIFKKHLRARGVFDELATFNDLTRCSGYLLDIQGQNFGIYRNRMSDEEYRRIIAFEITTLQFMGSPEEIKSIISIYFAEDKENIFIREQSGKVVIVVPNTIELDDVKKLIKKIKTAGVGYLIDYEVYIEDYLLSELEEKTLQEIESITLARR